MQEASRFARAVLDTDQVPISRDQMADWQRLTAATRAATTIVVREAIDHRDHSSVGSGHEPRAVGDAMRTARTSLGVLTHEAWVDADEIEREGGNIVMAEGAVRALNHEPHLLRGKRQRKMRCVRRLGQATSIELCVATARDWDPAG